MVRVRVFSLAVLSFSLTGCLVPKDRYDEAMARLQQEQAAHQTERAAHQEAEQKAERLRSSKQELEQQLDALRARLATADQTIERDRETLAEVRFSADVIAQEREEARQMAEQLRTELERIAAHLRAFAEDKELLNEERDALARQLSDAEARLMALAATEHHTEQRFRLVHELSLQLTKPLERRDAELTLSGGEVALRFPERQLFAGKAHRLSADGKELLGQTVMVLRTMPHEVQISYSDGTLPEQRAEQLRQQLIGLGLSAERVVANAEHGRPGETASSSPVEKSAAALQEETQPPSSKNPPTTEKQDKPTEQAGQVSPYWQLRMTLRAQDT